MGEPTEPRDYYAELIAAATECIVGKNEGETEDDEDYEFRYSIYENYGFSYMIYLSSFYTSMRLGYLIEDIDGNGTEELIFGQNDEPDSLWDDIDNPWFYLTQSDSIYDSENKDSVSEEQARKIIEKYVYEHPTFVPFVEE